MRRMLTAKLQNRSGVLNRFTGVLSRRQVNIESISVGATENPNVSRITIIIDVASHDEVEQIIKQLNRQVDVIRVRDITDKPHLEREVILVKVLHQLRSGQKSWPLFNLSVRPWSMWPQALSPFK